VEEAMTLWRKALARNPAMTAARVNLGVAQYQSGHRDEARATFSEALKWDPGSAAARRMLDEIVP
jgi:Flp pilus assembly protein TadD